MPRQPALPPGVPFFARIDNFHCECPACGDLLYGEKDPRSQYRARQAHRRASAYNPLTAQLRCPSCGHIYGVGLVLWSLDPGPKSTPTVDRIPADQQPTARQRAQLRAYTVGIWADERKVQGDPVNILVEQPCTCLPGDEIRPERGGGQRGRDRFERDPFCPVHGWAKR